MNKWLTLCFVLFVSTLTGCGDITTQAIYSPLDSPHYQLKTDKNVHIRKVVDSRGIKEEVYFYDEEDLCHGTYDRPVADIVHEAIVSEFESFGFTIMAAEDSLSSDALVFECEITAFDVMLTSGRLGNRFFEASANLTFAFYKPNKNELISIRKRTSSVSIPKTNRIKEYNFIADTKAVRQGGERLLSEVLPAVIRQELASNKHLINTSNLN